MFSVKTKLTLSKFSCWGILIASACTACIGLGFTLSTVLLLINTISAYLIVILVEKNTLTLEYSSIFRLLPAIILIILPLFMYATSLTQGLSIFLSPVLSFYLASMSHKFTGVVINFSKERKLNKRNENEKWIYKEIKRLAKQANFPTPHIQFLEILKGLKSSKDINAIKKELPLNKKYLANLKSNKEFIRRLHETLSPIAMAISTLRADNYIFVGSNLLNHPKIKLSRKALRSILAHEFGHLKHGDSTTRILALLPYTLVIALSLFSFSLSGLFLSSIAHYAIFALSRNQEAFADLYSAISTSPDYAIEALTEMKKNKKPSKNEGYIETFVGYYNAWFATHPSSDARIVMMNEIKSEQAKDAKENTGTFIAKPSPV